MLYLLIGNAHAALGHYPEALAAFRYGRGMTPGFRELYDRAAAVLRDSGDLPGAARMELQKAFAFGLTPDLNASVERAYAAIPNGGCATVQSGGVQMMNTDCPRFREDLCPVLAELAATFNDARQPERARIFNDMAGKYGCAAPR
jgi:hypothetical protein